VLEPTGDYLKRRAQQLGLGRAESLEQIQAILDELYPGQARALSLNRQVLRLVTASSSVASELRMNQVELLRRFREAADGEAINNLQIQIRGL